MSDGPATSGRTLLVAGTASHVGKSTVAAGLCRHLADAGVAVAPYKAQNMSNNARAVSTAPGADVDVAFGEVGISQYVQARAARVTPQTDHNPVLLKPRGEGESQLVVNGQALTHASAANYYGGRWETARAAAAAAHERLVGAADVVVAEGAGSIAEINLHDRDLANVETARAFGRAGDESTDGTRVDVLLVADVERGGVFASIVGTLELLPADVRDRVAGVVITKFRGDRSLLTPGIEAVEERTGVPVLGVLPYDDPGLPEEDSLALPAPGERVVRGDQNSTDTDRVATVAVPRLPRISNATDVEPLASEPGVRVAYVPLDDSLDDADAVVLPGTKNTVDDLRACRAAGLDEALRRFDGPVVGLCGGYQLLGERITGADLESAAADAPQVVDGFGLLPVETAFSAEKRVVATELRVDPRETDVVAGWAASDGGAIPVTGYEIHMGETSRAGSNPLSTPVCDPDGDREGVALGAATPNVFGTYLHGLFENDGFRRGFVARVRERAGMSPTGSERDVPGDRPRDPIDRAARLVGEHVDLEALGLPPWASDPAAGR
jgi:adenosylcobyric acid synthase